MQGMTVAEAHDYDVFVSYAHADNDVPRGASEKAGWVSVFAENLNIGPNVLKKRLFIDHQLKPGDPFAADLMSKVERSAVLVLLLSQNYVKSDWCGKEVEHFIRTHGADPDKPSGVYVVELWPYDHLASAPAPIQLLRKWTNASKFWFKPFDAAMPLLAGYPSPNEGDPEGKTLYWRELANLRGAIDFRLGELGAARASSLAAAQASPPRLPLPAGPAPGRLGSVLLADTTEDLEAKRNRVRALLEPEGVRVLPEGDYVGLSQAEFDDAIVRDLAQADLFVQLLSPTAGRKGKLELPLPQLQYRHALAAGKPIVQWAASQPEADEIDDQGHARLFETATLRATHLSEFANGVLEWLRAEQSRRQRAAEALVQREAEARAAAIAAPATGHAAPRLPKRHIFIDDVAGEAGLSERVRDIIKAENFAWRKGQPDDSNIQDWLRPCVAGLTIYTDSSQRQRAQSRLIRFLNQVADGDVDLQHWGVFLANGTVASEFGFEADGLVGINEQGLAGFLRGIER